MAISRSVSPTVLVLGHVVRTRELRTKADGRFYATEVVIAQDSGAQLAVRVYERDGVATVRPTIGELWPVECALEESREFGAALNYERPAADALDLLTARA